VSDNDWQTLSSADKDRCYLARPLPFGVLVTVGWVEDGEPHPIPNTCQHDYTEAELEWLLQMARGEAPDGPR